MRKEARIDKREEANLWFLKTCLPDSFSRFTFVVCK